MTVGGWSEKANTDEFGFKNYYSDHCLKKAGGGTLDFYQIHTYAHGGKWKSSQPMKNEAKNYKLDKPVVVGEYASKCSENNSIEQIYQHFYEKVFNPT